MLGVFAEFETNLRRERQLEGISAAKARGVYKGRKPSIDATLSLMTDNHGAHVLKNANELVVAHIFVGLAIKVIGSGFDYFIG